MTRDLRTRAALIADDSLQGLDFADAYSDLADEWMRELLGPEPGVAVIAAGALGRRELAPASDLDLVLIHDGRRDAGEIADRIWYPIWDARIALDHSVRTPKEAVTLADTDLKVVLGLLDGRPIAGDDALAEPVLAGVRERWVVARAEAARRSCRRSATSATRRTATSRTCSSPT